MSNYLVEVNNISKKYCRDLRSSLWYGVRDLTRELTGQPLGSKLRKKEFWALKDVSFSLEPGQALGVIGPNGSGKSTLLKLLNGLVKPNMGSINIRGRVQALIQLGAGFNPILTGRENIYINAAVFGIPKNEIDKRLNDIIDFAELRDFIDTPVQSYSSGMKVRLGFSIAIYLRPDIMLIDEVLAVGDLSFRNKCLNAIQEIRNSGVAFVFVSHNLDQVNRVCDKAIYFNNGELVDYGATEDVISTYLTDTAESTTQFHHHPGTEKYMQVRKVMLLNEDGQSVDQVISGSPLTIRMEFDAKRILDTPLFVFVIEPVGRQVISAIIHQERNDDRPSFLPGVHVIDATMKRLPLLPGRYRLRGGMHDRDGLGLYGKFHNIAMINVVARENQLIVSSPASMEFEADWYVHAQV